MKRTYGDLKHLYRQCVDLPDSTVFYDVEIEETRDLNYGVTTVYPYRIGNEFSMTKGHRHEDELADEWYFCEAGEGLLQIEDGQTRFIKLVPGVRAYIHGQWGHRLINTGSEPLVVSAVYSKKAGHQYDIEFSSVEDAHV